MSFSSATTQDDVEEAPLSRIVITNSGEFTKMETTFSESATMPLRHGDNVRATILVVKGYKNLRAPWCLGSWMEQDEQLRSVVNEYLAQDEDRYWYLRTARNSPHATSAYWVRPVVQTPRKEDRARKIRLAQGCYYSPKNELHPGEPPLGLSHKKYSHWNPERLQLYHLLYRKTNPGSQDFFCYAAEERLFFYDCDPSSGEQYSNPLRVDGVVFLDPLRCFRIELVGIGHDMAVTNHIRSSPYFIPASEDDSAVSDSVRMDLGEVDSETRFLKALKRNWRTDDPCGIFSTLDFVNHAVADMMSDDISHVTQRIGGALVPIEQQLCLDHTLRQMTTQWRMELGSWRYILANLAKELENVPVEVSPKLLGVRNTVDRISRRVETAFDALVGSNTLARLEQERRAEGAGTNKNLGISRTWKGVLGGDKVIPK